MGIVFKICTLLTNSLNMEVDYPFIFFKVYKKGKPQYLEIRDGLFVRVCPSRFLKSSPTNRLSHSSDFFGSAGEFYSSSCSLPLSLFSCALSIWVSLLLFFTSLPLFKLNYFSHSTSITIMFWGFSFSFWFSLSISMNFCLVHVKFGRMRKNLSPEEGGIYLRGCVWISGVRGEEGGNAGASSRELK